MAIDESLPRAAARVVSRDDLRLEIVSPDAYAEVEALSRSAPAGEVTSPLTASLVAWFIDRNPAGPGFVVIARDAATNAPVGHFVFYRWDLARRRPAGGPGEPLPAFLFVRLYVDPAHRRRGIFSAMTTFGLEVVRLLGVDLAYTAPNPKSAPGFVKFGMTRLGPLPFWVRPAASIWNLAGGPASGLSRVEVLRRDRFSDDYAVPAGEIVPPDATVWTPRDAARLNWRYAARPDVDYGIREMLVDGHRVGHLVTRHMSIGSRQVVAICDAWTAPGHAIALRAGLRDVLTREAPASVVIAIGGTAVPELRRAYRKAGLVRCPARLLPQPVVIFATPAPAVPREDSWHLTPFDWDVF